MKHCAGGLDGFTPEDLTVISLAAAEVLADLLNLIEEGAAWPKALQHGKAAFLAKDVNDLEDCLKYKILLILPMLYRHWATIRLHDLEPWIDGWKLPEFFAGTGGQGAEDAV